MGRNMGLGKFSSDVCLMRKYRWLFYIDGVSDDGTSALPPDKGARPSLSFKEIEVQHLNEVIYFPGKPDWKPIQLTLFDLKENKNPVFDWIKKRYDTSFGEGDWSADPSFKKNASLQMYDGCGEVMETWRFDNAWPNNVEWGELDMASNDYVTVELTLRYDRAWIKEGGLDGASG